MQSELSPLFEKIRAANCLTESDMNALTLAMSELSARRELDALDSQWEKDIGQYIHRNAKGGKLGIASRGEAILGVIAGLIMVAGSLKMIVEGMDNWAGTLALGVIMLFGVFLAIRCIGLGHKVREYEQELRRYQSARLLLTQQLPPESRIPHRVCPHCLSEGQLVT